MSLACNLLFIRFIYLLMRIVLKTKIFSILALLAVIAIPLLFWHNIAVFAFEHYLHHFFSSSLDADISMERVHFSHGSWIVEKPVITGRKSIKEGGVHLVADRFAFQLTPKWWQQEMDIHVTLAEPKVSVPQETTPVYQQFIDYLTTPQLIKWNPTILVNRGIVEVHSSKEDNRQNVYFQLNAAYYEALNGCVRASVDDPDLLRNCIALSLDRHTDTPLALDVDVDSIECGSVLEVIRSWIPGGENCIISKGILTGKMALTLSPSGRPYAVGDLTLRDASFQLPCLSVRGEVEEATIRLFEQFKLQQETEPEGISGRLELIKGCSVVFDQEGIPFCSLTDIEGSIDFHSNDHTKLSLQGLCQHHGISSLLQLSGSAQLSGKNEGAVDVQCSLGSDTQQEASIRFTTKRFESRYKFAEIFLANMGPAEFDIITSLAAFYFPHAKDLTLTQGRVDASVHACMEQLKFTDLSIKKIAASDLHFHVAPMELNLCAENLSGDLGINLASSKILDTLNANLNITNGHISCDSEEYSSHPLSSIDTKLTIRGGIIQDSLVAGELAGLKGSIHLDGRSLDGELVKCRFIGGASGLFSLLPDEIKSNLIKGFSDDDIEVSAALSAGALGVPTFAVKGVVVVNPAAKEHAQKIEFGFNLEHSSKPGKKKKLKPNQEDSFWRDIAQEATLSYLPSIAPPLSEPKTKWLQCQLGIAGFMMKQGWFKGKGLPLDKYLTVLFDPEHNSKMHIGGTGDFEGEFDPATLTVKYNCHELSLENDDFKFKVNRCGTEDQQVVYPGSHFFDFLSGASYGTIPIQDGSYLEKRSGLLFDEIKCLASFIGRKMQFTHLQTTCSGIKFHGAIDAQLYPSDQEMLDVDVYIQTVQGKFSQLQCLLSHFDECLHFQKLPLEGTLSLRDKGAHLRFECRPGSVNLQNNIQGTLTNGSLKTPHNGMTVQRLSFNFNYNKKFNSFEITDILGHLVIGTDNQMEHYHVAGDQISITNMERNEAEFDVWIGNGKEDVIRVVGTTRTESRENCEDSIIIKFDTNLTHLGNIYPRTLDLHLKNWTQVEYANVAFGLNVASFMADMKIFSRMGLFSLPKMMRKELNFLSSSPEKIPCGNLDFNIEYHSNTDEISYRAVGQDVKIGQYAFQKCLLNGIKKGSTWTIDQLVLDDQSFAADLVRLPEGWKVNFLGLQIGESLLVGLEGEYHDGENTLETKVNLLEINLAKLDTWPQLQEFMEEYSPSGTLRATGQLKIELDPSIPKGWRMEALVNGSLRSWKMKGLNFQDANNVSFHVISDRGLTMRQLNMNLKESSDGGPLGSAYIEKLEFSRSNNEVVIDSLLFNIPAKHLPKTTTLLNQSFPLVFNASVAEVVSGLKNTSNLEGSCQLKKSQDSSWCCIALKEGIYHFLEQEHDIHNFVLQYDHNGLNLLTQYRFRHHLFWVHALSRGPLFNEGTLIVSDHHPEHTTEKNPLQVEWNIDPRSGFQIQKIEGEVSGLTMHLSADANVSTTEDAILLVGQVVVSPQKAAKLISSEFSDTLKNLQVGEGYYFTGQWRLGKAPDPQSSGQLHFHGTMEGNNFSIKGYRFQTMRAYVDYVPRSIQVRQLQIEDPAGLLYTEKANIFQTPEGDWQLSVPRTVVTNFKPSLLQEVDSQLMSGGKPLLIRCLEIDNLAGHCTDLSTLKASGKLQFTNPPKKNLQNPIFAIPSEILTILGLDLAVLNPVGGTIIYEVQNKKIYLTKFKDVYSEGRLSKFNLSNHPSPSYIDFDGQVHMQIRMKQYNLFFKLAELFTVNITGHYKKLSYSLNKQQASHSKL